MHVALAAHRGADGAVAVHHGTGHDGLDADYLAVLDRDPRGNFRIVPGALEQHLAHVLREALDGRPPRFRADYEKELGRLERVAWLEWAYGRHRSPRHRRCRLGSADQPRDPRQAAQVVEIDALELDAQLELVLDMQEQLDDLHRVEQPALQQVRIRAGHLDVQLVEKKPIQPGYHAHTVTVRSPEGSGRGADSATSGERTGSPWKRSHHSPSRRVKKAFPSSSGASREGSREWRRVSSPQFLKKHCIFPSSAAKRGSMRPSSAMVPRALAW